MRTEHTSYSSAEKVLFLVAALFCVAFIGRTAFIIDGETYFTLFDDAMISMVYAQNLAGGHGLVWNPGEAPVEGYTNFFWTLWMALLHFVPVAQSKTSLLVMLSGVACLLGNAVVVHEIADRVTGGNRLAILGSVAVTLFSYPLIFWAIRGMEVSLLVLLVDVQVLCSLRLQKAFDARSLGVLAGAIAISLLTRTDSVVPAAVVIAFTLLGCAPKERVKIGAVLVGTSALVMVGHTVFRVLYYHDPLPNTYYLKVYGTPLSERIRVGSIAFLRSIAFEIWPLIVLPLAALIHSPRLLFDRTRLFLLALFGGQCAYTIYVGGDAWEYMRVVNRYVSIVLPAGIIAFFSLLSALMASVGAKEWRASSVLLAAGATLNILVLLLARLFPASPFSVWGPWLYVYLAIQAVMLGTALYFRAVPKERLARVDGLATAGVLLPVLLCLNGGAYAWWLRYGLDPIEQEMTRVGLAVSRATRPGARLAVIWAGTPLYFSHRLGVDLLGKCDPFIAHLESHLPFRPGHSKWDLRHSIETYKPDLVLQLISDPDNRNFFEKHGYVALPNGFFVRKDSDQIVSTNSLLELPYRLRTIDMKM